MLPMLLAEWDGYATVIFGTKYAENPEIGICIRWARGQRSRKA